MREGWDIRIFHQYQNKLHLFKKGYYIPKQQFFKCIMLIYLGTWAYKYKEIAIYIITRNSKLYYSFLKHAKVYRIDTVYENEYRLYYFSTIKLKIKHSPSTLCFFILTSSFSVRIQSSKNQNHMFLVKANQFFK